MDEVGRSAWHKVGPNDAGPKHEPGRGQKQPWRNKDLTPRNHAVFLWF